MHHNDLDGYKSSRSHSYRIIIVLACVSRPKCRRSIVTTTTIYIVDICHMKMYAREKSIAFICTHHINNIRWWHNGQLRENFQPNWLCSEPKFRLANQRNIVVAQNYRVIYTNSKMKTSAAVSRSGHWSNGARALEPQRHRWPYAVKSSSCIHIYTSTHTHTHPYRSKSKERTEN